MKKLLVSFLFIAVIFLPASNIYAFKIQNKGMVTTFGVPASGGGGGGNWPGGLEIIGVDVSASPITHTISSIDIAIEEKAFIINDESGNAGINNITIDTQGLQKIDGVDSVVISVNYGTIRLYSRGNNLFSW